MAWRKAIREEILASIQAYRCDKELFGEVYGDAERAAVGLVWRNRRKPKAKAVSEAGPADIEPSLIIESAQPEHIRIEKGIWLLTDAIARDVAATERVELMKCLAREAEEFATAQDRLARKDVMKAVKWIEGNDHHADTVVIAADDEVTLLENKEMTRIEAPFRRYFTSVAKACPFVGVMGALNVYAVSELPAGTWLVYEKDIIRGRRTPLAIKFDDAVQPRHVVITEDCVAWTMQKTALAKVCLK